MQIFELELADFFAITVVALVPQGVRFSYYAKPFLKLYSNCVIIWQCIRINVNRELGRKVISYCLRHKRYHHDVVGPFATPLQHHAFMVLSA